MTESASLIEHVIDRIRDEVCSGNLLPGQRFNVTAMSQKYLCSKSTVRMALSRLVGEGLLEIHTNDGFYRPLVTDQSARDQYRWNMEVLLMGLDNATVNPNPPNEPAPFVPGPDPVADIEHFFTLVATLADNKHFVREIKRQNAILHPLRLRKADLTLASSGELQAFADAWLRQDTVALRELIVAYHNRRLNIVPQIVTQAYGATNIDPTRPGDVD